MVSRNSSLPSPKHTIKVSQGFTPKQSKPKGQKKLTNSAPFNSTCPNSTIINKLDPSPLKTYQKLLMERDLHMNRGIINNLNPQGIKDNRKIAIIKFHIRLKDRARREVSVSNKMGSECKEQAKW